MERGALALATRRTAVWDVNAMIPPKLMSWVWTDFKVALQVSLRRRSHTDRVVSAITDAMLPRQEAWQQQQQHHHYHHHRKGAAA